MSKTTPVRWWRDDADRYRGRPSFSTIRECFNVADYEIGPVVSDHLECVGARVVPAQTGAETRWHVRLDEDPDPECPGECTCGLCACSMCGSNAATCDGQCTADLDAAP